MNEAELVQRMLLNGLTVSVAGLISEKDFATLVDAGKRTVERMRLEGRGPRSIAIGNRHSYPIAEVVKFLNGERQSTPNDAKQGQTTTNLPRSTSPAPAISGSSARRGDRR